MKLDVLIPAYKPGKEFFTLIEMLEKQTLKPDRIIVINTEEKYFSNLVFGTNFSLDHREVEVSHISRREFDHGRTRNRLVEKSDADIFVMLTQDAMPADENLLKNLYEALNKDEKTAVVYGRQLARENSSIEEKLTRKFNYPDKSFLKTAADVEKLGIKAYFCSDVCAAYKRDIFDKLGGFINHTIFNEDMIYAAGAIKNGYSVGYCATARVYHSHDYTNRQQFVRNFDLGVSQADHPEVFAGLSSEAEGKKLVKTTLEVLWNHHRVYRIPHYIMQCGARLLGFKLGKSYKRLPKKWVLKITSNPEYFFTTA